MSVDAQRFMDLMGLLHPLWSAPVSIGIALYLLYNLLGVAAFAGLTILVLSLPLNATLFASFRRYLVSLKGFFIFKLQRIFHKITIPYDQVMP